MKEKLNRTEWLREFDRCVQQELGVESWDQPPIEDYDPGLAFESGMSPAAACAALGRILRLPRPEAYT